jgi:hypothetical protein
LPNPASLGCIFSLFCLFLFSALVCPTAFANVNCRFDDIAVSLCFKKKNLLDAMTDDNGCFCFVLFLFCFSRREAGRRTTKRGATPAAREPSLARTLFRWGGEEDAHADGCVGALVLVLVLVYVSRRSKKKKKKKKKSLTFRQYRSFRSPFIFVFPQSGRGWSGL